MTSVTRMQACEGCCASSTPALAATPPISFEHEGEQFIAVACGGNFQLSFPLGDAVMVFGLPKAWTGR
ncbi:MAG TPA: hypothetical protein VJU17_08690 [Gemmatimonadales bacterium]|nr:hypothetical protein [Gemmatimonadales bacterium]